MIILLKVLFRINGTISTKPLGHRLEPSKLLVNVTVLRFAVTFLGLILETQGERNTGLSSVTFLTLLGLRLLIRELGTVMIPKGLFEIRGDQVARAGGPGNNTDVC